MDFDNPIVYGYDIGYGCDTELHSMDLNHNTIGMNRSMIIGGVTWSKKLVLGATGCFNNSASNSLGQAHGFLTKFVDNQIVFEKFFGNALPS